MLRGKPEMYALAITFADHKNNAFVELGGAAWKTRKEQFEQWNSIPAALDTGMTTCLLLDRRGKNGFDIEMHHCRTARIAARRTDNGPGRARVKALP
jgi:hypothetical protein